LCVPTHFASAHFTIYKKEWKQGLGVLFFVNKNCPITIIFGTVITQTTNHQQVVSLNHLTYLVQLSYLGKLPNLKITSLASNCCNYWNRTILVQVVVENEVACFLRHSVYSHSFACKYRTSTIITNVASDLQKLFNTGLTSDSTNYRY